MSAVMDQRPSYRLTRLLPLDSSSRNLNQSAVSESLIEVPGSLAHSPEGCMLDFDVTIPGVNASYLRSHQMHSAISRLVLETRNGQRLADFPFLAEYMKTITPVACHHSRLQDKDYNWDDKGKGSSVFKSNAVASGTATINSNSTRITSSTLTTAAAQAPDMSYTDFQYVVVNTTVGTADPLVGNLVLSYSIPFSDIYNSFLSEVDPVYFNQSLNLRITWNSIDNIGFMNTTTSTTYTTGLAAITSAVVVSNIRMYLAVQTNQMINDQLIAQTNTSGWRRKIDYVHSFLQTTGDTLNASVQTRLNRAQGERLKAILTTYMHSVTNAATRYDHSNTSADDGTGVIGPRMVSTIYSQLNSKNLQEIQLDCSKNEDYEFLRPLLKGSVCGQSSDTFKYNNVWIDQWSNTPLCLDDGVNQGLDLSSEVLYTVTTTHPKFNSASTGYRVFTFAICRRDLVVSPGGIDVQVI